MNYNELILQIKKEYEIQSNVDYAYSFCAGMAYALLWNGNITNWEHGMSKIINRELYDSHLVTK